jgi:serine/threonine protein kinase
MTAPADNRKPRPADAEDANATVPVKGWNDAATILAARPASGSAVNLDQTVQANFNRQHPEADTVPTVAAPELGREATLLADSVPGSNHQSGIDALAQTKPITDTPGSQTPMSTTALSQSGLSRSFTKTGRTRVNLNLPAEAQQLDQKLQMSRTSVLSDMATARIGKGDLPPGITKLIEAQGTEGRYAIERPLAAGGMGAVLHINDHDFRRPAAMKVILSKYAANAEATERFLAEAQVTAQLEHPNIVPIHDLGVMEDGTLYFTMKMIEGVSLGRVVKLLQQQAGVLKDKDGNLIAADAESAAAQQKWSEEEKLHTFLKVLDGVGFAHSRGVVHRDLKPDNVMLGSHGEVLVVDWGIAKVLGSADPTSEIVRKVESLRDRDSLSATMDGSAMGTLYYMPPEQALGLLDEIDARSDVYALGATLYELLSLRRSLDAGNMADMIARISNGAWNRLESVAPHLNQDLIAIVHRSMARERAERYQSCAEFSADIRRYLAGQAVHARRRNFIERLGMWYAAHRRQVQVAAAGVVLVVGAVTTTIVINKQADRAEARRLFVQAKQDYDTGRVTMDVAALSRAQLSLAGANTKDPNDREIRELTSLVDIAVDNAKREEKARNQREAAAQRAKVMVQEARTLVAAQNLLEAEKTLDSALKLVPGDEDITAFLKQVVVRLGNEKEIAARELANKVRKEGDAVLAEAEALDRADPQVDVLLRQAEGLFAKAESVVPVDGTQAQVKKVALLRQAAETARKAKEDLAKGEAAATKARAALTAGHFAPAKDAIAQALGFIPNRADLVALRDQILVEENRVLTAQELAKRQAQAEQLSTKAEAALTAGDLVTARESAAQAWGLVPGHQPTEKLRQRIAESERQAAALVRQAELRTKATAALSEARGHLARLQDGYRAQTAATAEVDRLTQQLAGQPLAKKSALWQAHRQTQAAVTVVSESWSLTEAAAQNVLGFLAEDPGNPQIAQAKAMLADLYQARLTDARRRRDVANVAAFANLLTRYDDGRYANLLKDFGRLTVSGPAGTRIRISEVDAGADLRLVAVGKPSEVTLPAEPLALKGGRYQLVSGEVMISLVVDATAPVALTWPAKLPALSGMALRYVPPFDGRAGFLLGEREVSSRDYDRFLRDPAVWARAVAAWKEFHIGGAEEPALLRLVPRDPGHSVWQAEASDAEGLVLARLTMPDSVADLPISGVSRDDAEDYCAWLAKKSGMKVRLPTRLEWQSAAHGGDPRRPYPWGEVFDQDFTVGVWAGEGQRKHPEPSGSVLADVGPFGHLDLAGNLREWVSDRTTTHGAEVVGGAWGADRPEEFRTTAVSSAQPFFTNATIGFRILVELP